MKTAAGLVLLAALAAAFTFTPTAVAPKLSVEKQTYEVKLNREVAVDFAISPPLTRGIDHVNSCANQHFDRSKLDRGGGCLEQNANGANAEGGRATMQFSVPAHYEAYLQRLAIDDDGNETRQVSNIVSFDIFDLCHLVADVVPLPPTFTMLPGAPAPCSGGGNRHVTLHSDDGSKLRIVTSAAVFWNYSADMIRVPLLRLNGQGKQVTLDYRSGPRLGRIATQVSVPAVTLFPTGQVDLSIVHRNGVATVRVKRGTAVGFRFSMMVGVYYVRKACPGRPTLACLKKIHYTVGGLKKREEHGKVLRAGQTARFKYRGWR